jgi:hypothetical protein
VQQRRGFTGAGLALTLVVLAAGLAGGGAAVRLRPDLFALPRHAGSTIVPVEKTVPAAAVEPAGAPAYNDRLGGTRAERGGGPRSR